jgi:hypothetical protein
MTEITTTGLAAHPARSAAGYPHVQGKCPACGDASLFLASGGYVTCASLSCTDPSRASDLLSVAREHHRVGPGRCACGWDAYKQSAFIYDYGDALEAHITSAKRARRTR